MQWEKAIEKIKNAIQVQVRVRVWTQKRSNTANSTGKLRAPDTVNMSKQQSNNRQCSAAHSGLLAKTLVNLI